ncbi:MAG: aminopeptidase [Bacteroidales bacterium]|nr:aminopeptidase [Bacteroidales bacterium]
MLSQLFIAGSRAQENLATGSGFIIDKLLHSTPVKDQSRSGTCWSFAAVSFIESELLRTGRGYFDLSEMYVFRNTYLEKAEKYIRMHGNMNFGSGGEANDVTSSIRSAGIVPDAIYPGSHFSMEDFNFDKMDKMLKDFVNGIVNSHDHIPDLSWGKAFESMLDSLLGPVPDTFIWEDETYTPLSFASSLGLNMDDYILIGSYTHHPFYDKFILEIPDNWSWEYVYNVPLDELVEILDQSVLKGYTAVWATDISEEGFSFEEGLAVVREQDIQEECRKENFQDSCRQPEGTHDREAENSSLCGNSFITQEKRQRGFDNYATQDDHAMHIIGTAKDSDSKHYYYVKNSWGTDNPYDGHFFVSEDYFRYKTISIMINLNALDHDISKLLKLQ